MKEESIKTCRFCGRQVRIITWGVYRKIVVDANPVNVVPAEEGEDFVRPDGSKIRGVEAGTGEQAYRPHRKTCEA